MCFIDECVPGITQARGLFKGFPLFISVSPDCQMCLFIVRARRAQLLPQKAREGLIAARPLEVMSSAEEGSVQRVVRVCCELIDTFGVYMQQGGQPTDVHTLARLPEKA